MSIFHSVRSINLMEDLLRIKLCTSFSKNLIFWEEEGVVKFDYLTFQIENIFFLYFY